MKLLLAARLSKSREGQTGLESQTIEAEKWAGDNGHEIIGIAADKKSGITDMWARPNLKPWLTDPVKLAQYDGIVAYKSDRLSRAEWSDEIQIRLWAQRNGKHLFIVSPALHWPPANQAEQIAWEIFATQAHEEWKNTSERYRRMQNHLRTVERADGETGYFVGRPPFGYRITCAIPCGEDGCKHHKILTPDPELVPYLTGMVERYLNGDTLTSICEWLDSEGIKPTGHKVSKHKVWQQKTIRDVLSNPVLMGRRDNGAGKTLKVTPVIDLPTWHRLQAKLAANLAKPVRGKIARDAALLTGIIFCARCQGVMHYMRTTNTRNDGSKQYNYYYRCDGTTRDRSTCRNMFPLASADGYMDSFMTDVIGKLELVMRDVVPGQNHNDELADIDAAIAALDQDAGDYDQRHAELRAERRRVKDMPKTDMTVGEKRTGVSMADHWNALDTAAQKRQWLLSGLVRVLAYMPPVKGVPPENMPEPTAFPADGRPFTFSVEVSSGEWSARPWES